MSKKNSEIKPFIPAGLQGMFEMDISPEAPDVTSVDDNNSTEQEAKTSSRQEYNPLREHECNKTINPESKIATDVAINKATCLDGKNKRKHESKTSRKIDSKRTRIDEDGGTRSPHNITMRDDYFKAFQMLALENGNIHEAWKYLDEACHNYLKNKGLLTK